MAGRRRQQTQAAIAEQQQQQQRESGGADRREPTSTTTVTETDEPSSEGYVSSRTTHTTAQLHVRSQRRSKKKQTLPSSVPSSGSSTSSSGDRSSRVGAVSRPPSSSCPPHAIVLYRCFRHLLTSLRAQVDQLNGSRPAPVSSSSASVSDCCSSPTVEGLDSTRPSNAALLSKTAWTNPSFAVHAASFQPTRDVLPHHDDARDSDPDTTEAAHLATLARTEALVNHFQQLADHIDLYLLFLRTLYPGVASASIRLDPLRIGAKLQGIGPARKTSTDKTVATSQPKSPLETDVDSSLVQSTTHDTEDHPEAKIEMLGSNKSTVSARPHQSDQDYWHPSRYSESKRPPSAPPVGMRSSRHQNYDHQDEILVRQLDGYINSSHSPPPPLPPSHSHSSDQHHRRAPSGMMMASGSNYGQHHYTSGHSQQRYYHQASVGARQSSAMSSADLGSEIDKYVNTKSPLPPLPANEPAPSINHQPSLDQNQRRPQSGAQSFQSPDQRALHQQPGYRLYKGQNYVSRPNPSKETLPRNLNRSNSSMSASSFYSRPHSPMRHRNGEQTMSFHQSRHLDELQNRSAMPMAHTSRAAYYPTSQYNASTSEIPPTILSISHPTQHSDTTDNGNSATRSYAAVAASPQQKSEAGGRQVDNDEKDAIDATLPPLPQPEPSDDVLEQKPLVKSGGPPSAELAKDPLSQQMLKLYESTRHSEELLHRKLMLRDLLASHIMQLPFFRMSGLYVVGSSLNGFGNNSSDMDVCLMFTEEEIDQRTEAIQVLVAVEELFNTLRFVRETNLIRAKVPILRVYFNAPYADIIVDLNANNSVAIRNTHMLCHYAGFDWRVQPLVVVVKEWARRRHINDANRSSFSSYSLVLMVVHYLQCGVKNPVLPSLQALYPHLFNSETNVRTLSLTETLPPLSQMNGGEDWRHNWDTTLGELLVGFFHYYSHVFDFDRFAISVRLGQVVDRTTVANMVPPNLDLNDAMIWRSQWHFVCIEEPFSLMNTAHSIYDMMVFDSIKRSFREAYDQLRESADLDAFLDNSRPIHFAAATTATMMTHPIGGSVSQTRQSMAADEADDTSQTADANAV